MRLVSIASAFACVLVLSATSAASLATLPAGNLLQDPGAEAAVPQGAGEIVVPIPGWQTDGGFTAVGYGVTGTPSLSAASSWGGGSTFFYGGPSNALSHARQTVDVSAAATQIDTGAVPVTLSAALGGYEGQNDNARVTASFRNSAGTPLATLTIGPVMAADRGGATKLVMRSKVARVPSGTRSIEVVLTATRTEGAYNDGSFDNISLTLTGSPAGGSPVGLWRIGSKDYRWVAIKGGYEERSMTPHRLRNKCLIGGGEAVDRYFAYGSDTYRVQYRTWRPRAGGPGKNGLNCTSRWTTPQPTVRIVVNGNTMTVSCDNNVTKVCYTYRRIGS